MGATRLRPSWITTYDSHHEVILEVDADIYHNQDLTNAEIKVVKKLLHREGRKLGNPHIDIACGIGRHSIELARDGTEIFGLDYSSAFVQTAWDLAQVESVALLQWGKQALNIKFAQGDARALDFRSESFSSATLLGGSFGFFDDDGNTAILTEAYRILKNNGVFIMDCCDRDSYVPAVHPYSRYEVETKSFGLVVDERWREWHNATKTLRCRKRHMCGDTVLLDTKYHLRLYSREELTALLTTVGFKSVTSVPFDSGQDLGAMSDRNFFFAVK